MMNQLKVEDWELLEEHYPTAMAKMRALALLREWESLERQEDVNKALGCPFAMNPWSVERMTELRKHFSEMWPSLERRLYKNHMVGISYKNTFPVEARTLEVIREILAEEKPKRLDVV
jgi:hypothetical protein